MEALSTVISRPPPPAHGAAKKSPWQLAGLLVGAAVGGLLGYLGTRFGLDLLLPLPGAKLLRLLPLASLPLIWLLVVGWHELGHVVGGWLVGGRFLLWVVGPVMVRRTPAGIRVGWNRNVNTAGGMAACLPLEPARMTPGRVAVMILGGPVASVLLTIGALWLAAGLGAGAAPVSLPRALLQNVALFTAATSLLIFFVTAVPVTSGGFKSDGKRVFELLRGDRRSEQEAAMLMLTTAGLAGIRPADYDLATIARVVSLRDGSLFDLYGHLLVYYHAADRAEWAAAQAHLDYVLAGSDKVIPYVRDVVRCEYAWLLARQTTDAAAARAWLESAGKLEFDPATRLCAEAAVLLAEGGKGEAAGKARAGLHALEHQSLSPVKSPFVLERLELLLLQAEAGGLPPA